MVPKVVAGPMDEQPVCRWARSRSSVHFVPGWLSFECALLPGNKCTLDGGIRSGGG
ncbi:hypothetical protein Intca_2417 [Intrasporangium calvum DSM 43043]|uniref:Uncharacterized protein n=1 Tax=Intrasporangium calvum (strain ATCC 23552 / DSM 43043 / JCM 3097 / NBRC 12989 / NCIMB 10167 / NRRL B-3866 / 7 KIP) TaxID=710696 RepID=E6S6D5_INTC7|nr:hypothetical protein Intca_2417 [Intrasporangium calvum DSM 43043]